MPDDCVLPWAKNVDNLIILKSLTDFLKSWYSIVDQFGESILAYIQKTVIPTILDTLINPTSIAVFISPTISSQ